jgi:hypothetical protein
VNDKDKKPKNKLAAASAHLGNGVTPPYVKKGGIALAKLADAARVRAAIHWKAGRKAVKEYNESKKKGDNQVVVHVPPAPEDSN